MYICGQTAVVLDSDSDSGGGSLLVDVEPEGVEYILRLRGIAARLAAVDQLRVMPDDALGLQDVR
jgi:hypothetical protein